MTSDATAELNQILDDLRRVVIAGDLAALPRFESALARATEALPRMDAAEVRRIGAKARGNLACLEAAARGVRAARRRLDEIRQTASGMIVAYDGLGRRSETLPESPARQRL